MLQYFMSNKDIVLVEAVSCRRKYWLWISQPLSHEICDQKKKKLKYKNPKKKWFFEFSVITTDARLQKCIIDEKNDTFHIFPHKQKCWKSKLNFYTVISHIRIYIQVLVYNTSQNSNTMEVNVLFFSRIYPSRPLHSIYPIINREMLYFW